jgi:hypothetical protein
MSEKGSEADIEPCRVNVAEVPLADIGYLSGVYTRPFNVPGWSRAALSFSIESNWCYAQCVRIDEQTGGVIPGST